MVNYVTDLENELVIQVQENKRLKEDTDIEMSVIVGAQDALTNIKSDLENQVEELVQENYMKE